MASQPPSVLPLFYRNLQPISSTLHANYRTRSSEKAPFFAGVHAIPLTIDEFLMAQRFFPIVFSAGDNSVPLALMGLNEGVNVFVEDDGSLAGPMYVPAYVRRYPWMLARMDDKAQELSLCFDPSSDLIGDFEEGAALFEGDKPSEQLNAILKFCEEFEIAAQRTSAFMKEVVDSGLLIDGEVSIQPDGMDQPMIYRGFQMVAEDKLRELTGDKLRKMNQNGLLPLLHAHLFSLPLIRDVFQRQMELGKLPAQSGNVQAPQPANS